MDPCFIGLQSTLFARKKTNFVVLEATKNKTVFITWITLFLYTRARSFFWQTRPGSRLVPEGHFCPVCADRQAGTDLLGVALQVVEFTDTEFSDAQLREQFADNATRVARQGRSLWPAPISEVGSYTTLLPCSPLNRLLLYLPSSSHVQQRNAVFP